MALTQKCQVCGSVIYPEHIDQGRAGRWAGQLLCPMCYAEKRGGAAEAKPAVAAELVAEPAEPAAPAPTPAAPAPKSRYTSSDAEEPISLEDTSEAPAGGSKIHAMGQMKIQAERKDFKRKTTMTGQGATRVRTFHSKIQAESIEFMDNSINEWLDDNPNIEVKFATTTIGTMAGKFPEPNIILNIWY